MKVSVLAILITAVTAPVAMAAETGLDCQIDDSRRAVEEQRAAPPPTPNTARPTVAQRDISEAQRAAPVDRRRNGKRIPDAELIGPRGAL
jgi:hypothetical protein